MLPVAAKVAKAAWHVRQARGSGQTPWSGGPWKWLVPLVAVAMLAVGMVMTVVISAAVGGGDGEAEAVEGGVNVAALPPAAVELLPDLQRILAARCPELPAPWLIAEIEVESSWNPRAYSSAGAAGLTQMLRASWAEAIGASPGNWPVGSRPPDSHQVWEPVTHLEYAVPWMCTNLRSITKHVLATGKPITPLQAMAVCHIAGCGRVTASATGFPAPGDAGCGEKCTVEVRTYVDRITALAARYTVLSGGPSLEGAPPPPVPYAGGPTGCDYDDPSSSGCLTGAAAHLVEQVEAGFGRWRWGFACWDRHAWNPTSDHPLGKACDYTVGRIGEFPGEQDTATGWLMAEWLRVHSAALQVKYLIFQGKIWYARRAEAGWTPYNGGGVYDPSDPTGGHYDHVHVSTTQ